jgi:hypothetical protein
VRQFRWLVFIGSFLQFALRLALPDHGKKMKFQIKSQSWRNKANLVNDFLNLCIRVLYTVPVSHDALLMLSLVLKVHPDEYLGRVFLIWRPHFPFSYWSLQGRGYVRFEFL